MVPVSNNSLISNESSELKEYGSEWNFFNINFLTILKIITIARALLTLCGWYIIDKLYI